MALRRPMADVRRQSAAGRMGARDETVLTKDNVKSMKLVWKLRLENVPKELNSLTAPIIVENVLTAEATRISP